MNTEKIDPRSMEAMKEVNRFIIKDNKRLEKEIKDLKKKVFEVIDKIDKIYESKTGEEFSEICIFRDLLKQELQKVLNTSQSPQESVTRRKAHKQKLGEEMSSVDPESSEEICENCKIRHPNIPCSETCRFFKTKEKGCGK